MNIILVCSVIALISSGLFLERTHRKRKSNENILPQPGQPVDRSCLLLTIRPCGSIIDKALECLSSHDGPAVCRNHRLGCETLQKIGKAVGQRTDVPAVYHRYMLDATEKIAETSRHIITSPENHIFLSNKCEIESIRESLATLLRSVADSLGSDDRTEDIRAEIGKDKAFIEHTIALQSGSMTHEEFDEGSSAYSYLILLYYLHSFVSSLSQIVKTIDTNNKKIAQA